MSCASIVAPGAFCFFATGVASSVGLSLAEALAVADGLAVGDAEADGDLLVLGSGVGDAFFFFFPFDAADGEFFGDGLALGDASGVWLGEAVGFADFSAFGDGLAFGDALREGLGFGEMLSFGAAEGDGDVFGFRETDGVGDALDFFAVEPLRFFGAGVGVGSKICLILSPNDCSACALGLADPIRHKIAIQAKTTPNGVIRSQRRRRGIPHGFASADLTCGSPSTSCEIPRRASPASG